MFKTYVNNINKSGLSMISSPGASKYFGINVRCKLPTNIANDVIKRRYVNNKSIADDKLRRLKILIIKKWVNKLLVIFFVN